MRIFSTVLLAWMLGISTFAQDSDTNAMPDQSSSTNKTAKDTLTFPVSVGVVTAPLVLTNGYIEQPEQTELPEGGKAAYDFTITNAGNYLIQAMVDAPAEDSNSFYVNVDTQPEDPAMIWDIDPTTGFEERTVSWRGNGTPESDEIVPKRFNLTAGAHKLIIVGREPTKLKSITIRLTASQ